jgi:hypothetical protein
LYLKIFVCLWKQKQKPMQIIEPIIIANIKTDLVYKMKPSYAIDLMKLIGYKDLKNQKVFEVALRDIINQVKNN